MPGKWISEPMSLHKAALHKTQNASLNISNDGSKPDELQLKSTSGRRQSSIDNLHYHVTLYCLKHTNLYNLAGRGLLYLYEQKRIAFCSVPKVGCSFWKRIIRFLNKDFQTKVNRPFDITRHYTHFGPFFTTPRFHLEGFSLLKMKYNLFMFARDPYSRLWSAYLDKLFLPDFWTLGKYIVSRKRNNATTLSMVCGHDVTFEEFLSFIVEYPNIDLHFAPIHTVCNPCSNNFSYIGKQETFVEDAEYIIRKTGLSSLLGKDIFTNTIENEIKSLSEDYLNLRKLGSESVCTNTVHICERLWKVFQLSGYIGFEVPFPSSLLVVTNTKTLQHEFILKAIEAYQTGKRFLKLQKHQKRQSLVNAYKTLPYSLLKKVQNVFNTDFELFDYDKEPKDIYQNINL